jgi:hypothetical protein
VSRPGCAVADRRRRLWVHRPQIPRAEPTPHTAVGWCAEVRAVAPGGLTLSLGRRLHAGTPLVIELPCEVEGSSEFLEVSVVESIPDGRQFTTGCAFAREPSATERAALTAVL